jgi:hypothetical protein
VYSLFRSTGLLLRTSDCCPGKAPLIHSSAIRRRIQKADSYHPKRIFANFVEAWKIGGFSLRGLQTNALAVFLISVLAKAVLVGPSEGLSCPLVKTLVLVAFENSLANCYWHLGSIC